MQFFRAVVLASVAVALSACGGSGTSFGAPTNGGGASRGATPAPGSTTAPGATAAPGPTAAPGATASPSSTAAPGASASPTHSASPSGSPSPVGIPFPATADSDAFYAQPNSFPNSAPGTILASRSVTFAPVGGVPMSNKAWEIKFVSRDANDNPIAAVATVVLPTTPSLNSPEPLLAVQFAEDGLGAQCAPSHDVTGSTVDSNEQLEGAASLQGLTLGWTVVYPDYEGPNDEFGAGRIEGQITLDSIRAAESFAPAGLNATTPVGMTGYSGGAIATAWAASLEQSYAPELKMVAIASGGTPASPKLIIQNIDSDEVANAAFFSLILSAVYGTNRAYPTLLTPILNAAGVAAGNEMANGCLGDTASGGNGPTGVVPDFTTTSDPVDAPNVVAILPQVTLPLAGHSPIVNTLVYHSQLDELIPIAGADAMVAAWCAAGSPVEYYRGVSGDHVTFEATTSTLIYAYLESRFNGTTTLTPPGTTTCN